MNATAVDDLFGFGEIHGRVPPIFEKLPKPNNTIFNSTGYPLYPDALYVLATSADSEYMLCSMSASLSPSCTTEYHVGISGSNMNTSYDDDNDSLVYNKSVPGTVAPGAQDVYWVELATQWASAINFNDGISDSNASNGRLLTQMIPTSTSLDPSLPSIAEALAVLAGCTLLAGGIDAPFTYEWDAIPGYQAFNASVQFRDFASGPAKEWQKLLYLVLGAVSAINVCYFAYFIRHRCLVTDFMEPQNLFTLAMNSPRSQALEGTCGCGPEAEQLKIIWTIGSTGEEHFYLNHLQWSRQKGTRLGRWAAIQARRLLGVEQLATQAEPLSEIVRK